MIKAVEKSWYGWQCTIRCRKKTCYSRNQTNQERELAYWVHMNSVSHHYYESQHSSIIYISWEQVGKIRLMAINPSRSDMSLTVFVCWTYKWIIRRSRTRYTFLIQISRLFKHHPGCKWHRGVCSNFFRNSSIYTGPSRHLPRKREASTASALR